ncbi:PAS domain S-box protein [Leptolyngbya sp. FACHB-321]|uniref:PAS domain-containing protein n=1 Tax=Leptolyngbya sp. FACHB-321 TaxID=2692807 RepID=UPI00168280BE|nr:PAS domain-containing protein [Leptolyngbya sp. FACHB-321]MBD2037052.1 PAS domain S-box protein [Leptolyngbya sp. FACHB-321]
MSDEGISLSDVLLTEALSSRSPHELNLQAEIQILRSLGQHLTQPPHILLNHFAEIAKDLCQAGTAGVSLLEATLEGQVVRWAALAGAYKQFERSTFPLDDSTCGICLELRSAQLFSHPERYFTARQAITPWAVEELVVPLLLEEKPVGTIWIVTHDGQRQFDHEDAQVLTNLAAFLAVALSSAQTRQIAEERQRALHESESRVQTLVRNMPGMVYRYHGDTGTFSYISSASRELFELEPEVILQDANALWSLFHPDDALTLRTSITSAVQNSLPWQWEGRVTTPSGQLKWIQGSSRPESSNEGLVWDGFVIDISDRKRGEAHRQQSENALREQKARLRLIIESAKDYAIFTLDLQGNITSWNSGAQRILGYEEAEIVGQTGRIIFTPEDAALGEHERELHIALTQGRKENERWHLRRDRSRFWGSGIVMPLNDEDGEVRGFVKILQDKTTQRQAAEDLRQSEARLQLALSVGRMGSWDWNLQTNVVRWSEGHFTLLGLQPGEVEPSYTTWQNSIHPEDLAVTEAALHQTLEAKVEYHHQYRCRWRDGSVHWLEARGQYSYASDGQPTRMIGIIIDISDRKQVEHEREQLLVNEQAAREAAETANRIKDEFLAVLSHELRSPLNPILGWVGLLRNGRLDAVQSSQALETIERNARLQVQLIEDLLDISRILRGKLTLNQVPINLITTIEAAMETVRLAAEAKGVALNFVLATESERNHESQPARAHTSFSSRSSNRPSIRVLGDSVRLQQVMWNLLSNGVKFTPESGQVEIRLEQVGGQKAEALSGDRSSQVSLSSAYSPAFAQITVSDTGRGIPAAFLPYVFESFRQADSTTTRSFGGLGLGLAIVRQLVELHGGSVYADSSGEEQGAVFTVRLPLLRENDRTKVEDNPVCFMPHASCLTGMQVLVVDDEPDARDFITFMLEQNGAIVTSVPSASDALQAIAQTKPDVLISDIGMPEMDGYDLIRQIRSMVKGKQVLAIALTAYAGEVDRQQAIAAGFQEHVTKPVEPETLIQIIQQQLNQPLDGD